MTTVLATLSCWLPERNGRSPRQERRNHRKGLTRTCSALTSTAGKPGRVAILGVAAAMVAAIGSAQPGEEEMQPVFAARDGHTLEESLSYRADYSYEKVLIPGRGFGIGDANVYYNLHWDDVRPVNVVRRAGPVWELPSRPSPEIGKTSVETPVGRITLDELAAHERSRLQGFIVVHRGAIVYEIYPGMRRNDNHIWFSVSKTLSAMVLTIMEAQGKIRFSDPVDRYIPEMKGTNWEGIAVRDIMDMASGLDLEETPDSMGDRRHKVHQYFKITLGGEEAGWDGEPVTIDELIYSIDDVPEVPPGTVFEYSSLNTRVVTMLTERIGGKRFAELLSDYIWQFIGAEADGFIGVNPSGGAEAGGMMNSRLRDLARYGLFFTPSGDERYGERARRYWGVKELSLADRVNECRPELLRAAWDREDGAEEGFGLADLEVRCNSLQWDLVYTDGDMYKSGVGAQGLYVSPSRDLVIAYYSTSDGDWERFARAVAKNVRAVR